MERLREKLKSECGASILLALLFLLLCMMVAASVLMAAASNAGKLRSNQEEHQKYLTVSSALRLVCGELERCAYYGHYTYHREDVTKEVEEETVDANGNTVVTIKEEHDYYIHTYTQTDGEFNCGLNAQGQVLPLGRSLDQIFAKKLAAGAGVNENPDDEYQYEPKYQVFQPPKHTMTVTAEGFEEVTVSFEMREDGVIHLVARLAEGCAMEAELTPKKHLSDVLLLKDTEGLEATEHKTEAVAWQLDWIAKKEVSGP